MAKPSKNSSKMIRKIIAVLVGGPITIIGIILIPLPGPGVLITLIGLYILSRGFSSLEKHFDDYKEKLVEIYRTAKKKHDDFLEKHDL